MKVNFAALMLMLVFLLPPAAALAEGEAGASNEAEPYTVAWISDPQHYSAQYPALYSSMTAYLNNKKRDLNLQYVVCTGDLVNDYNDERQWAVADAAFYTLYKVPYGVLAGNHDYLRNAPGGWDLYKKYFGQKRFQKFPCYAKSFEDNRGHVDLLDAGSTKFVFVYMSYKLDDAAIAFIKESFLAYPDRVGILCLHDYCYGDMELTRDGKKVFEQVVSVTPNIYLVLCGHEYGVGQRADTFIDPDGTSRTVTTLLQNYQAAQNGGGGYFKLFTIDEAAGTLAATTYSPALDDYNYFDTPDRSWRERNYVFDTALEEFTMPLPWA